MYTQTYTVNHFARWTKRVVLPKVQAMAQEGPERTCVSLDLLWLDFVYLVHVFALLWVLTFRSGHFGIVLCERER